MNTFENLDSDIPDLVKKIVVPLRGKEIDEHSFAELFKKLVYLQGVIKNEPVISRKIAGYLFYLLTRYPSSFVTLQQKWIKAGLADHTALLFDLMILWLKDMVSLRIGRKENFVYIDQMDWMGPLSFKRETGEWVRLLARAVELQKRLRFNANPQLVVEKMLVDIQGV